jgi:hypothetical protein
MRRIPRIPVIVATTMLVLTWCSGALAQVVGLDWKIQYVTTTRSGTPNNPITEGAQVKVRCEWTATICEDRQHAPADRVEPDSSWSTAR